MNLPTPLQAQGLTGPHAEELSHCGHEAGAPRNAQAYDPPAVFLMGAPTGPFHQLDTLRWLTHPSTGSSIRLKSPGVYWAGATARVISIW